MSTPYPQQPAGQPAAPAVPGVAAQPVQPAPQVVPPRRSTRAACSSRAASVAGYSTALRDLRRAMRPRLRGL